MKFHDYLSYWSMIKNSSERVKQAGCTRTLCRIAAEDKGFLGQLAMMEFLWYESERPYYNVYPSVLEMLKEVSLDVPFKAITLPLPVIAVRFPDHLGLQTKTLLAAIVCDGAFESDGPHHMKWSGLKPEYPRRVIMSAQYARPNEELFVGMTSFWGEPDQTVEEVLATPPKETERHDVMTPEEVAKINKEALRIVVGVSILANDPNFVQPIVLNRDQFKYEGSDEAIKKRLEDRAARLQGRGYSVGKGLEETLAKDHSVSPHMRRPHMALFWTGKGRTEPRLQLRRGCVVKPHDITEVPTGYLGAEEAVQ